MTIIEEEQAQKFIDTLQFGDVFRYKAKPPQLVFLHRDQRNGSPDCIKVVGDVAGEFTLDVCGTITLDSVVPEVIKRLSLAQIESHFEQWRNDADQDLLEIIRGWAKATQFHPGDLENV